MLRSERDNIRYLIVSPYGVICCSFHPFNSNTAILCIGNAVLVMNVSTGKELDRLHLDTPGRVMTWSDNGALIIIVVL